MNKEYYGIVSGLHDLVVGKYTELTIPTFKDLISMQLSPRDYYQCLLYFYAYDIQNMLSLATGSEVFSEHGNLNQDELQKVFKSGKSDDVFFSTFMDNHKWEELKQDAFSLELNLTQHNYDFLIAHGNTFTQEWVRFDVDLKNLTVLTCCKLLKINPSEQFIQGGNIPGEELKRLGPTDLGSRHPLLKQKFEALDIKSPIDRKLKVHDIKWKFLDDATFFQYFSIERLQTYTIKLIDLDLWNAIDKTRGQELLTQYVTDVNNELEKLIQ